MESLLKYVVGEMRVIADAPFVFSAAVLILVGGIWWLMDWRYGGIVSNRDAEIALLRSQRDDYREKLGGASPDQARARIDVLEQRLRIIEPRFLMPEQRKILFEALKLAQNTNHAVVISHDGACADCNRYATDFMSIFTNIPGWQVKPSMFLGAGLKSPKGLTIFVPDPTHLLPEGALVIRAFEAAKLSFEIYKRNSAPDRGSNIEIQITAQLIL